MTQAHPSRWHAAAQALAPVWARLKALHTSGWLVHSARTAVAAAASLGAARLIRMPQAYWACISATIVMQSTLGAAWDVSKRRLIGTAIGAAAGGLFASWMAPGVVAFGAAIFALGLACALLRVHHTAYRFAAIAFAIVSLVAAPNGPAVVALHRFVEVSIGLGVALALTAIWPSRELPRDPRPS